MNKILSCRLLSFHSITVGLCLLALYGCGSSGTADSSDETTASSGSASTLSVVSQSSAAVDASENAFVFPDHFPKPRIPDDNPLTPEKIELGRFLFYDRALSRNEQRSCADCHQPALGFAEALPVSVGIDDSQVHPRNAMSLTNVVYNATFNWSSPLVRDLENQAHGVLFSEEPVELGWSGFEEVILGRLQDSDLYKDLFEAAFSEQDPFTIKNVQRALASFERTLISATAPYDHFTQGDKTALSESAKRGLDLFFGERLECFHCHGGFNLSQSVDHANQVFDQAVFHNNGLYNIGGTGDYPINNTGLWEFIQEPQNMGKFRAPTLRNIALTAPYMHDGTVPTLEAVIEHYARGGRLIESGERAGDGKTNPYKSELIAGFIITEQEKQDLLAFFHSLTDWAFICRDDLQDPFGRHLPHENCN